MREFPGSAGNYFSAADGSSIDITGTALTISAFVVPTVVNQAMKFLTKRAAFNSTSGQFDLSMNSSGQPKGFVGDSGGLDSVTGALSLTAGVPNHVALRKNGTGASALAVFLAGLSTGTATSNRSIQNTAAALMVGVELDGSAEPLSGAAGFVAIWAEALSDAVILALAKGVSPHKIGSQNLRAFWPLYGLASPEPDLSGNAAHLTMTGTVPVSTKGIPTGPLV